MAKGSELSTKELEELLDTVDMSMERLKTLYEQYFMGIQKQAPAFIHSDVERKLRDLTQLNMRNTGLRYRLATLQQKFGAYNSYWRRTLRQIENGTYLRNLAKIGRDAARTGAEVPEEILAKMPKRMREQVQRDRDAALAIARRRNQVEDQAPDDGLVAEGDFAPVAAAASPAARDQKTKTGAHILADDDGDIDFDSLFSAFQDDAPAPAAKPSPAPAAQTMVLPKTRPDHESTQDITRPIPKTPTSDSVATMAIPRVPAQPKPGEQTAAIPRPDTSSVPRAATGPVPIVADPSTPTSALPKIPQTSSLPRVPTPGQTGAIPRPPGSPATQGIPAIPRPPSAAAKPATPQAAPPSPTPAAARPTPASTPAPTAPPAARPTPPSTPAPTPPPAARPTPPSTPRPGTPPPVRAGTAPPSAALRPPPGMTEADVNALHAKYVKAKEAVGEKVDASSREKLLRTINQTAPKIMEQYKASGVDFSVVVKDNQVVIKAKPKT